MPDEADELYALPLDEYTAARNALAKETGDASIRALKKPTVAAWAVNQLSRRREVDLRRLLRAGEQLERAQAEAVRGGDQKGFEQDEAAARAEEADREAGAAERELGKARKAAERARDRAERLEARARELEETIRS